MKTSLCILAALAVTVPCLSAAAASCPEARAQFHAGAHAQAEATARRCLERAPDDPSTWALLGRTLAAAERYDEALAVVRQALVKTPHDEELIFAQTRALAWSGRLDEAWKVIGAVPPSAFEDRDNALVAANVALWRKDHAEAAGRYDAILTRWPGDLEALRGRALAREELGELEGAHADHSAHCSLEPGGQGCTLARTLFARRSKYLARAAPGFTTVEGRQRGWNLSVDLQARFVEWLLLIASVDRRTRDFGFGAYTDTYCEGAFALKLGRRVTLTGAAGGTVAQKFSPLWTAQLEPAVLVGEGLEVSLRYWRLAFPESTTQVLAPGVTLERRRWLASGRYFFGRQPGRWEHSGSLRFTGSVGDLWTSSLGGGGGVGLDYLELRHVEQGNRFWFALAGVGRGIGRAQRLTLDYVHRRESHGPAGWFRQHSIALGYEVRL